MSSQNHNKELKYQENTSIKEVNVGASSIWPQCIRGVFTAGGGASRDNRLPACGIDRVFNLNQSKSHVPCLGEHVKSSFPDVNVSSLTTVVHSPRSALAYLRGSGSKLSHCEIKLLRGRGVSVRQPFRSAASFRMNERTRRDGKQPPTGSGGRGPARPVPEDAPAAFIIIIMTSAPDEHVSLCESSGGGPTGVRAGPSRMLLTIVFIDAMTTLPV
ncbi:hypothetical protein EVAR_103953_1 [Eumeta japonica]|uniref:Uncharacterized protein n=1 Tax=Eumeta variegata TaxID=151549 RepID=A0A4C1YBI0_EUMVA|nr:hypothetical protein EVAR_103953_1 [Eumeta japonica]